MADACDLDRAGREPTGAPGPLLLLGGKASLPLALALFRLRVGLERPCEPVEPRRVRLLRVLPPPGGDRVLLSVPLFAERRQRPGDLDGSRDALGLLVREEFFFTGLANAGSCREALADELESPVVGEARRPTHGTRAATACGRSGRARSGRL